jgi:hypothetical protein
VSAARNGARPPKTPSAAEPGAVAKKWAEQTAEAQGLPLAVLDPSVVQEVAVLLASGRQRQLSRAPDGIDAVRIEPITSSDGRLDHDSRKDGGDDGPLPGRIKVLPLGPQHAGSSDELVERRGA